MMSLSEFDALYPATQVPTHVCPSPAGHDAPPSPVPTERDFRSSSPLFPDPPSSDGTEWKKYDVEKPCFMEGSVKEVSLKYFKESLLPPLREGLSVHAVSRKLELDVVNDEPSKKAPWAKLMKLAEAVAECGQQILEEANGSVVEPTALFTTCPPVSENAGYESKRCFSYTPMKPSSCVVSKEQYATPPVDENLCWYEIAVLGYIAQDPKNHDAEVREMNTKVVTSMLEAMRRTPHRRFVFAYSVDRTPDSEFMRLWFLSHSDILVSKPFNCRTTHLPFLIHFLLSIQFATRSQLGYDTTMTIFRGPAAEDLHRGRLEFYDISVHPKPDEGQDFKPRTFRTVELISYDGAQHVFSNANRSWIGLELDEDGKPFGEPVTIRDYWVHDKRRREGDTVAAIREAAKNSGNAKYVKTIEDHLVQVVCHGDVYIDGVRDNTTTALRRGSPLPQDHGSFSLAGEDNGKDEPHCSLKSNKELTADESLSHYRIVYKGIGNTIEEPIYMYDLLAYLPQALECMSTMHALGFLHGDINPENMLLVDGKVTLRGLEYAQKIDEETIKRQWLHQKTTIFTSLEVMERQYLFLPQQPEPKPKPVDIPPKPSPPPFSFPLGYLENEDDDNVEESQHEPSPPRATTPPAEAPSPPAEPDLPLFKYNILHDFESLWWDCLFLLVNREIKSTKLTKDYTWPWRWQGNKRITAWGPVLGGTRSEINPWTRQCVLELDERFDRVALPLVCAIKKAGAEFNKVRKSLVAAYKKAEEDVTKIDYSSAAGLHDAFKQAFEALSKEVKTLKTIVFDPLDTFPSDSKNRPVLEARIEMIRLNKAADDLDWVPPPKKIRKEEEEEKEKERYESLNEETPELKSQNSHKRGREDDEEEGQWEEEGIPHSSQRFAASQKKRRLSLDDHICTPSPRASPPPKSTPTKNSQVIPSSQDNEVEMSEAVVSQLRRRWRSTGLQL